LFEEALRILERSNQPEHPAWIRALDEYSLVLLARRDYQQAEALLKRSLALAERTLGSDHPEVARILHGYAAVMRKTGRKSQARKLEARAARIQQDSDRANAIGYTVDLRSLSAFRP
jgi:tetratricopeptide (TPR) repeat protein